VVVSEFRRRGQPGEHHAIGKEGRRAGRLDALPDGLLVIDKPEGPTSHDVVARVRRALHERSVGHTGTLDPLATGVLPLVLGRATRLAQFLSADEKRYRAHIRLGTATTTYDREGEPVGVPVVPTDLTRDRIEAALDRFRGTFPQTPPAYSAKKVGGVSAHRLARRGAETSLAAATVTVHELTLGRFDGLDLEVDLKSSAGFYVRSLAHDLGIALGCGAHLCGLRRTAVGAFDLSAAVALAVVETDPQAARSRIQPMSSLLPGWPALSLTERGTDRVRHGGFLGPADCEGWDAVARPESGAHGEVSVRLLDRGGDLVALGAWVRRGDAPGSGADAMREAALLLHPRVVLV